MNEENINLINRTQILFDEIYKELNKTFKENNNGK